MRGEMTLKRVSRRRSEVGRTSSDGGLFKFRPRYVPEIILTSHPTLASPKRLAFDTYLIILAVSADSECSERYESAALRAFSSIDWSRTRLAMRNSGSPDCLVP